MSNQSSNTSSTTTYHTLKRTWSSQANPSGQAEAGQPTSGSANMNYGVERFARESMKDQPYNAIEQFAEQKKAESHHVGGEEGSNAGQAGSGTNSGGA
ncbi:hypothetical protein JMJ35_007437 [Cladonia borealis]|uniref:Uncharacterized protein n=1 Tax=Cladonia borealis TaxID=184061 RepID=A0AA39UZK9_9LECA|nr:hypothetical protein JMJ35_007437 [Cladonia borealis]